MIHSRIGYLFQLVALPSRQKTKTKDNHHMTELDNDDFMKKYHIECPSLPSLGVVHAEPVSFARFQGYTFSDDALRIIDDLVAPGEFGAVEFNEWLGSGRDLGHQRILFFLDGLYAIAHHIWSIRRSIDEIAMTSYLGPAAQKDVYENPPPVGLLYVEDVPTLAELAKLSPFLGQLLPMADGPEDGFIWAYFLGRVAEVEAEESERAEAPREHEMIGMLGGIAYRS